jgi:hypothetical protein
MKTDMTLKVKFSLGEVFIKHKTLMIDAHSFVRLLNKYREENGMQSVHYRDILKRQSIQEFIALDDYMIKIGKGRAKTYFHLELAIRVAIELSPHFAKEVIETFINKRLTDLRDLGGDKYIELNDALTMYAETVLGKQAHKGHFINLAKLIKKRLEVDDWNSATPEQNAERMRIEQTIVSMLKTGVVKDWNHLKELITKV